MAVIADAIAFFHLLLVLFIVIGEFAVIIGRFFSWGWIRSFTFRITHLALIVYVALEATIGGICPLTVWEYNLRQIAGQETNTDVTFVGRLIHSVLFWDFPPLFFTWLYIGFGILVLLTFIFIPPRKPKCIKHN